jgi:hypothetical protein
MKEKSLREKIAHIMNVMNLFARTMHLLGRRAFVICAMLIVFPHMRTNKKKNKQKRPSTLEEEKKKQKKKTSKK